MAYQNTGYARNTTLTVTKGDYSKSYDITHGFTDPADQTAYDAIGIQTFQRLNEADYNTRLQAFLRHVCSLEDGLQADCPNLAQGSVEYNPAMCPLPQSLQDDIVVD